MNSKVKKTLAYMLCFSMIVSAGMTGIFLLYVVCNWAMCTLFDGEGSMKNIFIVTAYSLIPYICGRLIGTLLSHILIRDEYIFIQVKQMLLLIAMTAE